MSSIKITAAKARQDFKKILDDVTKNKSVITISRAHGDNVVMVAADQYLSMSETLYLLSNPQNSKHLAESLKEAKKGKFTSVEF